MTITHPPAGTHSAQTPCPTASHSCSRRGREETCSCLENKKIKLHIHDHEDGFKTPSSLAFTSKATISSLFIVFAYVWLVVPPHCAAQVGRGTDGAKLPVGRTTPVLTHHNATWRPAYDTVVNSLCFLLFPLLKVKMKQNMQ